MINEESYINTISKVDTLTPRQAIDETLVDDYLVLAEKENIFSSDLYRESKGKHVQTFSARVLDWDEFTVKVELLINRDEKLYQVRTFPIEMFKGTQFLQHGYFIRILFFVKKREFRTQIEDGKHFVNEDDFKNDNELKESDFANFKF